MTGTVRTVITWVTILVSSALIIGAIQQHARYEHCVAVLNAFTYGSTSGNAPLCGSPW